MAQSPAHQFGQIIGETLEIAIEPLLRAFASRHNLYLDKKGKRAARKGQKVSWMDKYGIIHDLDYVLERGGTDEKQGAPVAFIEAAWRRYTKHSRNKAQEIQGAILPLLETYRQNLPFYGAVLGGVFKDGALDQLRSLGFSTIYFPYDTILSAFAVAGIDAASNEETPDAAFRKKVRDWKRLGENKRIEIAKKLIETNQEQIDVFLSALAKAVKRKIVRVIVLPLHGVCRECQSIAEAAKFIEEYREQDERYPLARYEVEILYSNNDRIRAEFEAKPAALQFLRSYAPNPVQQ